MSSQINLTLNEAPKGTSRYFVGKDGTLQPKILARPNPKGLAQVGVALVLVAFRLGRRFESPWVQAIP